MKTFVPRWKAVIKDIHNAIGHAEEQGLPLSSIELDSDEWDAFVEARTTLPNGTRLAPSQDLVAGKQIYKGIKIYKEKQYVP